MKPDIGEKVRIFFKRSPGHPEEYERKGQVKGMYFNNEGNICYSVSLITLLLSATVTTVLVLQEKVASPANALSNSIG